MGIQYLSRVHYTILYTVPKLVKSFQNIFPGSGTILSFFVLLECVFESSSIMLTVCCVCGRSFLLFSIRLHIFLLSQAKTETDGEAEKEEEVLKYPAEEQHLPTTHLPLCPPLLPLHGLLHAHVENPNHLPPAQRMRPQIVLWMWTKLGQTLTQKKLNRNAEGFENHGALRAWPWTGSGREWP